MNNIETQVKTFYHSDSFVPSIITFIIGFMFGMFPMALVGVVIIILIYFIIKNKNKNANWKIYNYIKGRAYTDIGKTF